MPKSTPPPLFKTVFPFMRRCRYGGIIPHFRIPRTFLFLI